MIDEFAILIILAVWFAGIVLAKAGWLTFAACIFPPYGMYLFAEKVLKVAGWVL